MLLDVPGAFHRAAHCRSQGRSAGSFHDLDFSAPAGAAGHSWLPAAMAGQFCLYPLHHRPRKENVSSGTAWPGVAHSIPSRAWAAQVAASAGIRSEPGEVNVLQELTPAAFLWGAGTSLQHTAAELPAPGSHSSGVPCFSPWAWVTLRQRTVTFPCHRAAKGGNTSLAATAIAPARELMPAQLGQLGVRGTGGQGEAR